MLITNKIKYKSRTIISLTNLKNNKINWKKRKIITLLLYKVKKEIFPKEEEFLRNIANITIKLSDNN